MRKLLLSSLALLALAASPSRADFLAATPYTEFVFKDSTRFNTDSQGRVAVGGDAYFMNYAVASGISGAGDTLLVGGSLTQVNGKVNGTSRTAGHDTLMNVDKSASTYVVGDLAGSSSNNGVHFTQAANGGIAAADFSPSASFSTAQAALTAESTSLGAKPQTPGATVSIMYGNQLFLKGAAGADVNIFHVTASQLRNAGVFDITTPVPKATVIINVDNDGTAFSMPNTGTNFHGTDLQHVLYNFYAAGDATHLGLVPVTMSSVNGSVLAPFAAAQLNSGAFNGQLATYQLFGSGETHVQYNGAPTQFLGTLPAVPEPSSIVLLAGGLLGVGGILRRKLRQAA